MAHAKFEVAWRAGSARGRVDISRLRPVDVFKLSGAHPVKLKNKQALLMTTALRSFLRFARYREEIKLDLAACVPPVAS